MVRVVSGPVRWALLVAGAAVGYLIGRRAAGAGRDRRRGPAAGRAAQVPGTVTAPVPGSVTPVRPAVAPAGQRPGADLGYHPGRPADEDFAADVVSGASATTASHPYEVRPGRTTASPVAPVGDPVVPTGTDADGDPPPLRRRPDRPSGSGPRQPRYGESGYGESGYGESAPGV
ncbi:hypothetical protein O7623_27165 [Solwaraspora sp. WMMD791]|uniref:hypothetical protein n=1 Tax=Solwaraspora sp. WMMD791 TaxID=3016086 RepID=UPI00249CC7BD|nr:hypothetical protein [Solwaraspora sp. WMMD791]WFE26911.1 hypothetical protein O7623_27165 [Solwaraspora sp. WMMD791]